MKQNLTEFKGEIEDSKRIARLFNTHLQWWMKKLAKRLTIKGLNNSINQLDLVGIHRILCPTTAEYKFFSSVHGAFSGIDHILVHETRSNKFKRTEIKQKKSCNNHEVKIDINHRKEFRKSPNMCQLNNTLLNSQLGNDES